MLSAYPIAMDFKVCSALSKGDIRREIKEAQVKNLPVPPGLVRA